MLEIEVAAYVVIALIVAGAIIYVVCRPGRRVKVSLSKDGISVDAASETERAKTSVLDAATLEDVEADNVTGADGAPGGDISVGRGVTIKRSKLGDVTGVKVSGGGPQRNDDPAG